MSARESHSQFSTRHSSGSYQSKSPVKRSLSRSSGLDEFGAADNTNNSGVGNAPSSSRAAAHTEKNDMDTLPPLASINSPVINIKRRRPLKKNLDSTAHEVKFTISISLSVPTVKTPVDKVDRLNRTVSATPVQSENSKAADEADQLPQEEDDLQPKKKKGSDFPKPLQYYRFAYHLLPDDEDPTVCDVVIFPNAAKLYGKGGENTVLKTWKSDGRTWFAFQHVHRITVTKAILEKLFHHEIVLRIWNTKDKVSTTTRFDRPKPFRLPVAKVGENPEDVGGVRPLVMLQSKNFMQLQPKRYFQQREDFYFSKRDDVYRLLPHEKSEMEKKFAELMETNPELVPKKPESIHTPVEKDTKKTGDGDSEGGSRTDSALGKIPHTLLGIAQLDLLLDDNIRTYSRLGRLAAAQDKVDKPVNVPKSSAASKAIAGGNGSRRGSLESRLSREVGGKGKIIDKEREEKEATEFKYKESGVAQIYLRIARLFAGMNFVTNRLELQMSDIFDGFCSLSINTELMNEQQKKDLNPLTITIESTCNMPKSPISIEKLKQKCLPVYCRYKFGRFPWYKTPSKQHEEDIFWNDINIVLLGTMEIAELREYLCGPNFEIEVHDRDRRVEKYEKPPALFGVDHDDDKISSVGVVANKRTVHNAFESHTPWDPYGVAKFDMSEMLLGQRKLHLRSPIHLGPLPDVLGYQTSEDGKVVGTVGAIDAPVNLPLAAGHYIDSGSVMKVTIELSYPITDPLTLKANIPFANSERCPFGRLVYAFDFSNKAFLERLLSAIREINAQALSIDHLAKETLKTALSTYRLSDEQKLNRSLDLITGFYLADGEYFIFILEGIHKEGIQQLWSKVQRPENDLYFRGLYDSDLMFLERLYLKFGPGLQRVRLHEPLTDIMQQPLLYVRDMVPRPCFEALSKLSQLRTSQRLRDAVKNNLFPDAEMLQAMGREFGIPLIQEEYEERRSGRPSIKRATTWAPGTTSRTWTPINTDNEAFMQQINERNVLGVGRNFINENIEDVNLKSMKLKRTQTEPNLPVRSKNFSGAHNYSSQHLNTTQQSLDDMRVRIASNGQSKLYTYAEDYHHSGTFVPVNVAKITKEEALNSVKKWKDKKGFVFPGHKTSLESNAHPKQPDAARLKELHTFVWRQNILHEGELRPTLPYRDMFRWPFRKMDMDLWSKPKDNFGQTMPDTIMLAGDLKNHEEFSSRQRDNEVWSRKLVVDDPVLRLHRVNPGTEKVVSGPRSSNQIDKNQGLLKDQPLKTALAQKHFAVPSLYVLDCHSQRNIEIEQKDRKAQWTTGPWNSVSLQHPKNVREIPRIDHSRFVTPNVDLKLINREHSNISKQKSLPLTSDEMNNYLFSSVPHEEAVSKHENHYSLINAV